MTARSLPPPHPVARCHLAAIWASLCVFGSAPASAQGAAAGAGSQPATAASSAATAPSAPPRATLTQAPAGGQAPELLISNIVASDDDPRAALAAAQQQLAQTRDPETRLWWLIAIARTQGLLEDPRAQRETVVQAKALLQTLPPGRPHLAAWLELEEVSAAASEEGPQAIYERLKALRERARQLGDAQLRCEVTSSDLWRLVDGSSLDEAWLAAEELERCARSARLPYLEPVALAAMGEITSRAQRGTPQAEHAIDYFERALASLGSQPARFRRSLIEFDIGNTLRELGKLTPALSHLRSALALSRSLHDRAGIAAANIAIARIQLEMGNLDEMPKLLDEARTLLADHDDGSRMITVMQLRIRALAKSKRPEVIAAIDYAQGWDRPHLQPTARARLARAMAEGFASQGQWARAYAELERASQLEDQGRAQARDTQVLRLQQRYDTMRREAENAELRHRTERSALALEAQTARHRVLWLTIAVLALLAATGAAIAWRLLRRRRTLLDLALKDPLTGSANRRAVSTYAQAQLTQTQRLGMPLSLALIDLDHFKQVNDTYGHATGDELLRAFARAAQQGLRGQDRLGRWGGEEWLLVMPGTPGDELPHVFERLRTRFAAIEVPGMPNPHGITFSMGVATATAELDTLPALLAHADQRLYQAKADGRDTLR